MTSKSFDIAINNLLRASAALDSVGMSNGSILSLKLASLVLNDKNLLNETAKLASGDPAEEKPIDSSKTGLSVSKTESPTTESPATENLSKIKNIPTTPQISKPTQKLSPKPTPSNTKIQSICNQIKSLSPEDLKIIKDYINKL